MPRQYVACYRPALCGILLPPSCAEEVFSHKERTPLLRNLLGSGQISVLSGGITLSKPYTHIESMSYDRGNDTLDMIVESGGVRSRLSITPSISSNEVILLGKTMFHIGTHNYIRDSAGKMYESGGLLTGALMTSETDAIIIP